MVTDWRAHYGSDGIAPAIEEWLSTEPKADFAAIIEDAKQLVEQFRYGKIARFAAGEIAAEVVDGKLILKNYRETGLSVSGHCGEVNYGFYGAMRIKYPSLHMLQCEGARGGFSRGWNHWFTLISEHPFALSRRAGKSLKRQPIDSGDVVCFDSATHVLPKQTYLFDPTARTCSILDEREYSLAPPPKSGSFNTGEHQSDLVISLTERSAWSLTVLGMCPESKGFLSIGMARAFPDVPIICVQKWIGDTSDDPGVRYDAERLYSVDDPELLDCVADITPGVLPEMRRIVALCTSTL